jgi:hypothetical protein
MSLKSYTVIESEILMTYILGWGGMALYPKVLIWNKEKKDLLMHEFIHIMQVRRIQRALKCWKPIAVIVFYIFYLFGWIFVGFRRKKIPFEIEAYAHQNNPHYIKETDPDLWNLIKHNFEPPSLRPFVPKSLRPSVPKSPRPSVPPSLSPSVPSSLSPPVPPVPQTPKKCPSPVSETPSPASSAQTALSREASSSEH